MMLESLGQFCAKNKRMWYFILAFIFLTYGFLLFHFGYSIDTEDILIRQKAFYAGWFGINRYGLVFIKWIFGVLSIIPGFALMLMIFTTFFYSIVWSYLYYYLSDEKEQEFWIFPVFFFSSVSVVELVAFQCLSFEAAVAMLLCALALIYEWRWLLGDGGKVDLMLGVLFGTWCFSCYQAFVPLYISASLACFILAYQRFQYKLWKKNLEIAGKIFGIFCVNYILYTLIGYVIRYVSGTAAGTYTDQMIQWGKLPAITIIKNTIYYFASMVFAKSFAWNYGYLLVGVGMAGYALWYLVKNFKTTSTAWFYLLVTGLFLLSPLFLPILMGSMPVVRGQLALPFVVAFGIQFLCGLWRSVIKKKKYTIVAVAVIAFLAFRWNIVTDNRLFYTDYVVRQQEYALTMDILSEIEKQDVAISPETPVAIVGRWNPTYNESMIEGETLGKTFYNWDWYVENGVQNRVLHYWESLGYPYRTPTDQQSAEAKIKAETMPCWPNDGSVIYENGMVIVKLPLE